MPMAEGGVRLRCAAPWVQVEPKPLPKEGEWRPSRRARQLALGVWIERQVEDGRVASYAEMARVLGVSRARVTQLVGLGLAPVGEREGWLQATDHQSNTGSCVTTADDGSNTLR